MQGAFLDQLADAIAIYLIGASPGKTTPRHSGLFDNNRRQLYRLMIAAAPAVEPEPVRDDRYPHFREATCGIPINGAIQLGCIIKPDLDAPFGFVAQAFVKENAALRMHSAIRAEPRAPYTDIRSGVSDLGQSSPHLGENISRRFPVMFSYSILIH